MSSPRAICAIALPAESAAAALRGAMVVPARRHSFVSTSVSGTPPGVTFMGGMNRAEVAAAIQLSAPSLNLSLIHI